MTIEWTNLSSGLLGAMIGLLGSFLLYLCDLRARRKGAGRALIIELIRNCQAISRLEDSHIKSLRMLPLIPGYSKAVWESQLSLIAGLLTFESLRAIEEPYLLVAETNRKFSLVASLREKEIAAGPFAGESYKIDADITVEHWSEELSRARKGFAEAAEILRRRVLTRRESQRFQQSLPTDSAKGRKHGNSKPPV
jgi:hypothetical protein